MIAKISEGLGKMLETVRVVR